MAACRAVPNGVVHQVDHHLPQPAGSATATSVGGVTRNRHPRVTRPDRDVVDGVAQEFVDAERAELQRNRAALDAREIEQIGHQFAEPLGLRQRHPHGLGVWFGDAVDDVLQHRVQGRDRGAQLV